MRHSTKIYIDDLISDYPYIDNHIENVIEEIKYPHRQHDENSHLPGSNLPSNAIESTVIKIADSERITRLKKLKEELTIVISGLSEYEQEFVERYYFESPRTQTIEGIAQSMNTSTPTLYRMRNDIRKKVADRLIII